MKVKGVIAKSDVPDAFGLCFSAMCLRSIADRNKNIVLEPSPDGTVTAYLTMDIPELPSVTAADRSR